MSLVNYHTVTLRASAATSGTSEQDSSVTLPHWVSEIWVVTDKTAEANADNVLTVRLQCQVGSDWKDIHWETNQITGSLTTAADTATETTQTPNIADASNDATFTYLSHYVNLPSRVIRVISISSGTAVANTFSVTASYRDKRY